MKNRITEILGSEYPIIQGPMRLISLGELAAAVSRSGGFGVIAASGLDGQLLRAEIRKARSLTDKPFGVNIPVYRPNALEALEIASEEGIRTITTSAGDPGRIAGRVKQAGMKMLHVVATVEMARKAEASGADGVIAAGAEGGGHVGRDEVTTIILVPQIASAVRVPVVAAGGIGDARGLVAAFALGAEGVQMGTRFLVSPECRVAPAYKEAIVAAQETDTMIAARRGFPIRVLKNKAAMALRALDESGAAQEEINAFVDDLARKKNENDVENNLVSCGQICGMIRETSRVEEIIRTMTLEAKAIAESTLKFFAPQAFG